VWSLLVVVLPPSFDFLPRLLQIREPVLVQAFIPKLPVEAFHVGILLRLAGHDEVQHHSPLVRPAVQRLAADLLPLPRPPARLQSDAAIRKQYETYIGKIVEMRKSIATVFAEGVSNGIKILPVEETLWGALNAVTAFVGHKQEIKGDRHAHILFGSGATLKQKAYELALAQLPRPSEAAGSQTHLSGVSAQ
jgi:hypothetical protein